MKVLHRVLHALGLHKHHSVAKKAKTAKSRVARAAVKRKSKKRK